MSTPRRSILLLAIPCLALADAALAAPTMVLGVQTHFEQGWPLDDITKLEPVDAPAVRDGLAWSGAESQPGQIRFDPARTAYVRQLCQRGTKILLVLDPRNPAYDGGHTVYTAEGRTAFARYLVAALAQFPGCFAGIEMGNEINADGAFNFPTGVEPVTAYVAILRATRSAMRQAGAHAPLILGSTNVIGTGFLEKLFAAGALDQVDAVAVHPYRPFAETVDLELDRLKLAMRRHGGEKPIWATEFGDYFETPTLAPPLLIKMVMLLAASGVRQSYWYVLIDEPWFKNMGLYDTHGTPKPAADAFRFAQRLLVGGPPVRLAIGDRRTFVFRLASGGKIAWGDPRRIAISGGQPRDSRGRPVPAPEMLSSEPIYLAPGSTLRLGKNQIIADSLSEYGSAPWSYFARQGDGAVKSLSLTDWRWSSRFTAPEYNPLEINAGSLATAGDAAHPVAAILRYSSSSAVHAYVSACFSRHAAGDGIDVAIGRNGKIIWRERLVDRLTLPSFAVPLAAGDRLDFIFSPHGGGVGNVLNYRVRLLDQPAAPPLACAA